MYAINAAAHNFTGLDFLIAAGALALALGLVWRFHAPLSRRVRGQSWLEERLSRLEQSVRDKDTD